MSQYATIEPYMSNRSSNLLELQLIRLCKSSAANVEQIMAFIEAGTDINHQDEDGVSALMALADQTVQMDTRVYRCIELLLKEGALMNLRDSGGNGALIRACLRADEKLVHLLIKNGVQVNAKGRNGLTPIAAAATQQDYETMQLLLNAGANPDSLSADGRPLLLSVASSGQGAELVQSLAFFGADINASDHEGWTALTQASRCGTLSIVHELIQAGVDLHQSGPMHKSALEIALGARAPEASIGRSHVTVAHFQVALTLLNASSELSVELDSLGLPPLIRLWRSTLCFNQQWMDALVSAGCSPHQKDSDGDSLWHWAAQSPKEAHALALIEWLSSFDEASLSLNHKGQTAAEMAGKKGYFELQAALVSLSEKKMLDHLIPHQQEDSEKSKGSRSL